MSRVVVLPAQPTAKNKPQRPETIHETFEAQASAVPEAVAVSFGGENLTYKELNERANQLAHHLRNVGVRPETTVALYLERSPRMVIAIIAVLKAGGAYVPIDLAYPAERLGFMLQDSQPAVLLLR